jgi:hypothetical protein
MTLADATDRGRRCHHLPAFCNVNGNTFAAVIRCAIAAYQAAAGTRPPHQRLER